MEINWTAVGAIGTIMAAIATYWAVITSLKSSKPNVKLSLMKNVKMNNDSFKDQYGNICDDVILITVANSGYIPITIELIGYLNRGTAFVVNPDPRLFNTLPIKIESSDKASVWTKNPGKISRILRIDDCLFVSDSLGNMYYSKINIFKIVYRYFWRKLKLKESN